MVQLEYCEWTNFWWDDPSDIVKERILLIGDSITGSYYKYVNEALSKECHIDMLGTSKGIDNPFFMFELSYMLKNRDFTYTKIHFNNGLHGWHVINAEYKRCFEKTIKTMIKNAPEVKIVIALTTPKTIEGRAGALDEKLNDMVVERNKIAAGLAGKYDLMIDDLYSVVIDKPEYSLGDGYHYNEKGQKALAQAVVSALNRTGSRK